MKNMTSISLVKKIIKDIRLYTIAKIIPGFFSVFAITIYTRVLSPEEYGLYNLVLTTVSIITAICFEWLNKAILRYFAEYKQIGQLTQLISTVVCSLPAILLVVLILWYLGVNLLQSYLEYNFILYLNIGGLVLLANAGYTFILCIRQANQESFSYTIRSIVNAILKLLIAICFIYFFHMGAKGVFWGIIISSGSIFILDIFSIRRRWQIKISFFSIKLFKEFLAYGLPLIGLSVASYILVAGDRYMIKYFLTTDDVGVYSASYTLSNEIIQFPMTILLLASYPVIMETFEKKGDRETSLLLNKIMELYFIFLMPIIFGIGALAKNVAYILLGKDFQSGYIIFPWVLAGSFCFGLAQYLYKPFELKKNTKTLSSLVVFVAILNIILNLFFIPKFEILGAAYTTLISSFVYLFLCWLISQKIFIWSFPWGTFTRTTVASSIMFFTLYFLVPGVPLNIGSLIIVVLIGAVCYFIVLWILREKIILQGFKSILIYMKRWNENVT